MLLFDTPILILAFNRIDTLEVLLKKIKEIRPKNLFVAIDGPRKGHEEDTTKSLEVQKLILNSVDWPCTLQTKFNEENLGCGQNPYQAISWFFDNNEMGIILEDDLIPSTSFFYFCQELLEKYKHDQRIMKISGNNFLPHYTVHSSYIFSQYAGNWGWATWRRAWLGYDFEIERWGAEETKKSFRRKFSKDQYAFFENIFDSIYLQNRSDVWDYQWWFHRLIHDGIDIIPSVNLVRNNGFNESATHTFTAPDTLLNLSAGTLNFPLKHPAQMNIEQPYDKKLSALFYTQKSSNLLSKVTTTLKRLYGWLFRSLTAKLVL